MNFDVAIVGAGPSGAWCARELAREGVRVALLHRSRKRRSTIELISPRARALLDIAIHGRPVSTERTTWHGKGPVDRPAPGSLAIDRDLFDATLRDHAVAAGAVLFEDTDVEADMRVIATGGRDRASIVHLAQRASFSVDDTDLDRVDITLSAGGWSYRIPSPTGGSFISEIHFDGTTTQWSVDASVRGYERVHGDRWIAIGNSAFQPDPLCGNGMWFALVTARDAANVILGRQTAAAYGDAIHALGAAHLRERAQLFS
ncbi:MAG: FAD-dependent monooxygenase [Kofleriaceae bacterium]